MANSIANGPALFNDAFGQTKAAAKGKEVWVTETGWPVSGPAGNQAEASTANAKTYWDDVGCETLFGKTNTWWYTLQDASPDTPSPSFGVVGSTLSTTPLYDLSCNASSSSSSSSSSAAASGSTATASGGGAATGVSSAVATASGADGGSPGISAGAGSVVTVGGTGAGGAGGATATLPGTPTNPTGAGSSSGGSGSSGSGSGSGGSGSGSGSGSSGGNGTVTGGSGSPSASTTAVITNAAPANVVSFGAAFVALLAACMIL